MVGIFTVTSFLGYFTGGYQLFGIFDYGFTLVDLSVLIIYITLAKRIIWDGEELKLGYHPAVVFFGLIVFFALMSGFTPLVEGNSREMIQYFKTTSHFLFVVGIVLVFMLYPIKSEYWYRIVQLWLIISIFINLFGVYQIFARIYDLPLAWLKYTNISIVSRYEGINLDDVDQLSLRFGDFYRATSIFSEPSALSAWNVFIMIFLIIPYIQKKKSFIESKLINGIIFVSSLASLFLTFSMTGLYTFSMIILAVFLIERNINRLKVLVWIGIGAVFLVLVDELTADYFNLSVMELFYTRVSSIFRYIGGEENFIAGESFSTRVGNGIRSIRMWLDNPILGSGMGLTAYHDHINLGFSDFGMLHAFIETGIFGGCDFLLLLAAVLYRSAKYIRYPEYFKDFDQKTQSLLGIAFYNAFVLTLINTATGNSFVGFALWLHMAMVISIINIERLKNGHYNYAIRLVKTPLKESFIKYTTVYMTRSNYYK